MNAAAAPGMDQRVPDAWHRILRRGERILWQGAPQQAFHYRNHYTAGFAGSAAALGVLALIDDPETWVVWVIVLGAANLAVWPPLWDTIKRRYSFYTLTDQRAFIGIDLPVLGRRLKTYPINRGTEIGIKRGSYTSVTFAHEIRRGRYSDTKVDIGFENLKTGDGDDVYDLLRRVREGTA